MPKKSVACSVETAIEIIGGRWKVLILQELFAGTRRFSAHEEPPSFPGALRLGALQVMRFGQSPSLLIEKGRKNSAIRKLY